MEPDEPKPDPTLPLGLLDAGDPSFVAALRAIRDSAALADFASVWHADARPEARQLLLAYLDELPNAPGHEGLIKRLFKRAEAAGDDAAMARFLVLTDRLIVRRRVVLDPPRVETFPTLGEAMRRGAEWVDEGVRNVWSRKNWWLDVDGVRCYAVSTRPQIRLSPQHTTLPRPDADDGQALASLTPAEISDRRWFSLATRRYLQRRVWWYFRRLGRTDPARYIAAATTALALYRDAELADGFALLERFGLMHLLFHSSPALRMKGIGWDLAPGQTLADLAPSPAFEAAWRDRPEAVWRVLTAANAVVIARWAVRWIEADRARFATLVRPADWVGLLDRDDPEVVALALEMLADVPVDQLRAAVSPAAWIKAIEAAAPGNLKAIGDRVARVVAPSDVPRAVAVRLATSPFEPLARLGWSWIVGQGLDPAPESIFPTDDPQVRRDLAADLARLCPDSDPEVWAEQDAAVWCLFPLVEAQFGPLRPLMIDFVGTAVDDLRFEQRMPLGLDRELTEGRPTLQNRVDWTLRADGDAKLGLRAAWAWLLLNHPDPATRSQGQIWVKETDWTEWRGDISAAPTTVDAIEQQQHGTFLPLIWDRVIRSAYVDIQAWCAVVIKPPRVRPGELDPVFAAVLLQPHGVARFKPAVIRQVVARLATIQDGSTEEGTRLIDLLAVVVRSARAPERRRALAGLVRVAEARPEWQARIEAAVPALQFGGGPAIMPALAGPG